MTGFVNVNRGKREFAFDRNCREPERLVKSACQSELNSSLFGKQITIIIHQFFSGLFYEKHLKYIELTDQTFHFSKNDLTYLLKENYDKTFNDDVYQAPVVTLDELRRDLVNTKGPVRIQYSNRNQYKSAAKALGIMDDFKVNLMEF
jgi:hypothetical protein